MSFLDKAREKLLGHKKPDEELSEAQDQPREDIELAAFVKGKVEEVRAQATRISHEGIWMTNIAYALGFDSVYYDPNLRQFRPTGQTAGTAQYVKRNRIHSNLILPAMQNRSARLLKSPPRYDVLPNSLDEEDKEAARLGEELIGHVWNKQAIDRKRIDLSMWVQECGHSYIGVSWDDQLGEEMNDPDNGESAGFEGEVRIDVVSAFEGFADPLAKTLEECQWFARAKVRKLDYFRSHYPERGSLVKEEGVWLLSANYEMRINTLNTVGPASSGTAEQMKGAAIEISYYEKRSLKYPKGRHVVTANGVLLKNGSLPVGEIPYAKFDDVVVGGKYYSEALVTHARPLQDQYNRTITKRADWVNKMLTGKYIAAKGHGLIQEAINDQSGEVVEYDNVPGCPPPSAMSIPVIPSYAYEESKEIKSDLNYIMGLSEVSRGQLPSASIPAVGIQLLLEQDETRMGIETEQHEHSWARVGKLILMHIDAFCETPRDLKVKGKTKDDLKIKQYQGSDLKKNFDVQVVRGSTVPNSKIIKRQEILNLYTQGLLGDPHDNATRDKVLGMLQYGEEGEVWEDNHLDMMQIQRDIENIEEGIVPEVDPKDNHKAHLIQKNRYRKSEKYLELAPPLQQLLQANIDAHAKILTQQMNPQLSTPPQMPPPPPPPHVQRILDLAKKPGVGTSGGAPPNAGAPPVNPGGAGGAPGASAPLRVAPPPQQ